MNANEDGWSSECPTTEGNYEYRHGDLDGYTIVKVYKICGMLWARYSDVCSTLDGLHKRHTNPQWRPLRGADDTKNPGPADLVASETPLTDAAACDVDTYAGDYLVNPNPQGRWVESSVARSLETRLADAVRELSDWRKGESAHREMARIQLLNISSERDAWKAIAGRLGAALKDLEWTSCGCDKCKAITQDLVELRRGSMDKPLSTSWRRWFECGLINRKMSTLTNSLTFRWLLFKRKTLERNHMETEPFEFLGMKGKAVDWLPANTDLIGVSLPQIPLQLNDPRIMRNLVVIKTDDEDNRKTE